MPAAVPTGIYEIDVELFAGGASVARTNSALEVIKTGFEQYVADAARDYGLLYGMATALMALLIGWFASVSSRAINPTRGIELVRQAALRRKGIQAAIAKQMCREGERPEKIGEGSIAHIKAAGESAESRHHHPHLVGSKAAAADRASPMGNSCDRVQMAADFPGHTARQVTESQRPRGK